jgi:hypothetical protein
MRGVLPNDPSQERHVLLQLKGVSFYDAATQL